jgi:hypothetical protein
MMGEITSLKKVNASISPSKRNRELRIQDGVKLPSAVKPTTDAGKQQLMTITGGLSTWFLSDMTTQSKLKKSKNQETARPNVQVKVPFDYMKSASEEVSTQRGGAVGRFAKKLNSALLKVKSSARGYIQEKLRGSSEFSAIKEVKKVDMPQEQDHSIIINRSFVQ